MSLYEDDSLDYPLTPGEDQPIETADLLLSAIASVEDADQVDQGEPPEPYGMTWVLDFEKGEFDQRGSSPAEAFGLDSLVVWAEMAIRSARYAHPVFSDAFGMESPEDVIGQANPRPFLKRYLRRLTDALLVHDRISAVENAQIAYDERGVVYINNLDIVTDDDRRLSTKSMRIDLGGAT